MLILHFFLITNLLKKHSSNADTIFFDIVEINKSRYKSITVMRKFNIFISRSIIVK